MGEERVGEERVGEERMGEVRMGEVRMGLCFGSHHQCQLWANPTRMALQKPWEQGWDEGAE